MNRSLFALLLFFILAGAFTAGAEDSRDSLERSRGSYRQAIARHGAGSPEARAAKQNLRNSRRSFHAQRRQNLRQEHVYSRTR